MKLKGINPFEQHVEKLVVGVAGAAALGVVALQFLYQPNMVQVGKGQPVRPAEAFAPVEAAAEALQGKLNSTVSSFPEVPKMALVDRLSAGFAASGGPKPRAIALGNPPTVTIDASTQVASDTFGLPAIPGTTGVVAASFQSTINPLEQVRNPDLAALLPAQQPFDKAAVSVEATFSGIALRDALAADPDGEGPLSPVPTSWWRDPLDRGNDLIEIIGIEMERQTIQNADGTSGGNKTVVVSGMPGRPSTLKLWRETVVAAGDVGPMLEQIWSSTEDIQRPEYYSTIAGPAWIPPSEVEDPAAELSKERTIENAQKTLATEQEKLKDLEERIAAAPDGKDAGRRENQDDRPPPPPRGKGLGGPAPRQDPGKNRDQGPTKQVLERQRGPIQARINKLIAQLKALGVEVADAGAPVAAISGPDLGLLENPELKVWGHDLTAERGATYRYRVRVVTNNPLFGRSLQPSQASLASQNSLSGPWSEWSAPVQVLPAEYFFVTSAESRNDITPRPRATAELFVFYYGFYRKASVSLEPGDRLMATAKLPELMFADMAALSKGPAGAAPGSPAPTLVDPKPDGGGRKGMMPGGPVPGNERGGNPADPSGGDPILTIAAPKERQMQVDATFLDVAQAPSAPSEVAGSDRTRYFAVLRNAAGQLVTRMADGERSLAMYRMFDASAKAGVTQGIPEAKPVELEPKRRDEEQRRTRDGGGGGGGGGG